MDTLTRSIRDIQEREGLTDGQMAERLGIARPIWNGIKNGRVTLSPRYALAAVTAFPELWSALQQELATAS